MQVMLTMQMMMTSLETLGQIHIYVLRVSNYPLCVSYMMYLSYLFYFIVLIL